MLVTFRLFHSRSLLFTFQQFSFHLLLLSNVFTRSNYLLSPPHCSLFLLCVSHRYTKFTARLQCPSVFVVVVAFILQTHTNFLSITLHIKNFIVSLPCFGSLVSSILFIDFLSIFTVCLCTKNLLLFCFNALAKVSEWVNFVYLSISRCVYFGCKSVYEWDAHKDSWRTARLLFGHALFWTGK